MNFEEETREREGDIIWAEVWAGALVGYRKNHSVKDGDGVFS